MKTIPLSETLISAVQRVCNYVGDDMERGMSNKVWAEVAIDAGRLTSVAKSPEAEAEVTKLIAEYGYPRVLNAIAKHTCYE